jgi:SEL1 protein
MRGANREGGDEDELSETMILFILVLAVSVLIYVRTRIVDRVRRDQQGAGGEGEHQAQGGGQQRNDGGRFPPPGDPAREDWAILR